jgi:hypothetical protein
MDNIEELLKFVSYFSSDSGDQGIGRYLLSLMVGLLGAMIPRLLNPEFTKALGGAVPVESNPKHTRALHLLLLVLILTSSLSSPAFATHTYMVFVATAVLYIWFTCLIKCKPVYIAAVLGMLTVAMVISRLRSDVSDRYVIGLMQTAEIGLYFGSMVATLGAVLMSIPSTKDTASIVDRVLAAPGFVWGNDLFGVKAAVPLGEASAAFGHAGYGESPLTSAPTTTFGYDYP